MENCKKKSGFLHQNDAPANQHDFLNLTRFFTIFGSQSHNFLEMARMKEPKWIRKSGGISEVSVWRELLWRARNGYWWIKKLFPFVCFSWCQKCCDHLGFKWNLIISIISFSATRHGIIIRFLLLFQKKKILQKKDY